VRNFKVPNYIIVITKQRLKKRPLELPQEKTLSPSENVGDLLKNENPYKSS
jgi:hypothetical protein